MYTFSVRDLARVQYLLDCYGLDHILENNDMTLTELLMIVEEIGYLNLTQFVVEDEEDYYEV